MIFSSLKGHNIDLSKNSTSYETIIRDARKTASKKVLLNHTKRNAAFVLSELFELALEHQAPVRRISGSLFADCYNHLTQQLARLLSSPNFAKHEKIVRVIVTEPSAIDRHNNEFYKTIINNSKSAEILSATNTVTNEKEELPHFAVIGNIGFRLETNHDLAEAKLGFNNPNVARELSSYFDDWFEFLSAPQLTSGSQAAKAA